MELDALVPQALTSLFREIVYGPPADMAFIVDQGDRGLIASLAALPASQASVRAGGRSSVAGHVQHLRYGLTLMNRWAGGDQNAFANASPAESWSHQQVTDDEWRALLQALDDEARQWLARLETPRSWGRADAQRLHEQRRPHRLSHGRHPPARPSGGARVGRVAQTRWVMFGSMPSSALPYTSRFTCHSVMA
jgi:hypothetical protein